MRKDGFVKRVVLFVVGTRPEVIKTARLIHELKISSDVSIKLCLTGQHTDLVEQVLQDFGLVPDITLDLMTENQTLSELTSRLTLALSFVMKEMIPDLVVVQGDTTSAFVGALTAFYANIPVAHVEAGLRTETIRTPFPEELNRRIISQIAQINLAPTESAKRNLLNSGVPQERIWVTGNTGIDALLWMKKKIQISQIPNTYSSSNILNGKNQKVLVTVHRRESHGQALIEICEGIRIFLRENSGAQVTLPVHPNPNVSSTVQRMLGDVERCNLVKPLGYQDFIREMMSCDVILTDSGGIQEEAPYLGKRTLVIRESTERIESVDLGYAKLVPIDAFSISIALRKSLLNQTEVEIGEPYGTGDSSIGIAKILIDSMGIEK